MTTGARGETTLYINHSDLEEWRKYKETIESQQAAVSGYAVGWATAK
jgi:hypothetical protein